MFIYYIIYIYIKYFVLANWIYIHMKTSIVVPQRYNLQGKLFIFSDQKISAFLISEASSQDKLNK